MNERWAKKVADKYIKQNGEEPGSSARARTEPERAWRKHAETVHRFLRQHVRTPDGVEAIAAFERIGDAIALEERRRK